jgi:hypothetical protein
VKPEAVYRALCSVDPQLEPWQKCEHDYESTTPTLCKKCGAKWPQCFVIQKRLLTFGDGKPRYQTVDELLALCERLDVAIESFSRTWVFDYSFENPGWESRWALRRNGTGKVESLHRAEGEETVLALQEALLRVMGKWEEKE